MLRLCCARRRAGAAARAATRERPDRAARATAGRCPAHPQPAGKLSPWRSRHISHRAAAPQNPLHRAKECFGLPMGLPTDERAWPKRQQSDSLCCCRCLRRRHPYVYVRAQSCSGPHRSTLTITLVRPSHLAVVTAIVDPQHGERRDIILADAATRREEE